MFLIVEPVDTGSKGSNIYDFIMMATIIISVVPLAFKQTNVVFQWIDYITVSIFILDYFLRLITADYKLQKSVVSFFLYPITPMAIIDLVSILPSITVLGNDITNYSRLWRYLSGNSDWQSCDDAFVRFRYCNNCTAFRRYYSGLS